MKLRPILFSTPMVQAIQSGTKTQTRRLVKPQPIDDTINSGYVYSGDHNHAFKNDIFHPNWQIGFAKLCPYGQPGDVLWIRETLYYDDHSGDEWCYQAGNSPVECKYAGILERTDKPAIPSIHMPYIACRLWLEITDVRLELLGDLTERDAIAEGVEWITDEYGGGYKAYGFNPKRDVAHVTAKYYYDSARWSYLTLWCNINAGHTNESQNPWEVDKTKWVWVVSFKIVDKP